MKLESIVMQPGCTTAIFSSEGEENLLFDREAFCISALQAGTVYPA